MKTLLLLIPVLLISSCASLRMITGVEVPPTQLIRQFPGPTTQPHPINVSTLDLIHAEHSDPSIIYGLYDAGRLASHIRPAPPTK